MKPSSPRARVVSGPYLIDAPSGAETWENPPQPLGFLNSLRANSTRVYVATIFTSAALLFIVQPMIGKMLLPLLGGAPAVWTTCMLFFQAALLGGYLYAHMMTRRPLRSQVVGHLILLSLGAVFLPLRIAHPSFLGSSSVPPVVQALALLALSVGVPFFALSASAPLLQSWFFRTGEKAERDPYFLYAASNLGSMISLLGYPVLVEPVIGLRLQGMFWMVGYLLLMALFAASGAIVLSFSRTLSGVSAAEKDDSAGETAPPSLACHLYWVALAFVPSSLMLGVTTYFTTDIATIPLLWIIPLSLYLLSFILAFSDAPEWLFNLSAQAVPFAALALLFAITTGVGGGLFISLFLHLATFALIALAFHGRISRLRPSPRYLTSFYLLLSVGGMLGGIFNGLLAPHLFDSAAEYPVALVLACMLLPRASRKASQIGSPRVFSTVVDILLPLAFASVTAWLCLRWPLATEMLVSWSEKLGFDPLTFHRMLNFLLPAAGAICLLFTAKPARFGLAVAAIATANLGFGAFNGDLIYQERSFFGVLRVTGDSSDTRHTLMNGTTLHGTQMTTPEMRREPLSYYHRKGPVGRIFAELESHKGAKHIASVGLGTGSLTAYGKAGDDLTIYEIDSAVRGIAKKYFTYLKDTPAKVKIQMGDARLKMGEAKDDEYDLILVDAFSSDAIPVHLLTREAVELYLQKARNNGLVAIHTSNRYLSLEPVLARIADSLGAAMRVDFDAADDDVEKLASSWVIVARDEAALGELAHDAAWVKLPLRSWFPRWTDDFTSVLSILK